MKLSRKKTKVKSAPGQELYGATRSKPLLGLQAISDDGTHEPIDFEGGGDYVAEEPVKKPKRLVVKVLGVKIYERIEEE